MKKEQDSSNTKVKNDLRIDSDPNSLIIQKGNDHQAITEESIYSCTLLKFAEYIDATNGEKNQIIRNKKREKSGGFPWYKDAINAIKKSFLENSNVAIYEGINLVQSENIELCSTNQKLNITYSTEVLRGLLEVVPSFEFRKLIKNEFKPIFKAFKFNDIEIKVSSSRVLVFKAKHNGETIVGGAVINFKKKPFSPLQMRAATYLLFRYLSDHVAVEGEVVYPKYCICIDAYGKKILECPTDVGAGEIRQLLRIERSEFKKRWLTL